MKLSLSSELSGHVASIEVSDGYVHLEVSDLEPTLFAVDARALAAMLTFAAAEAER
jgi:hypothetical protein